MSTPTPAYLDRIPAHLDRPLVTMDGSLRVDLHQHLWTEPLIEALASRGRLPRIDQSAGRAILHSAGEVPYEIDLAGQAADRRTAELDRNRLDRAVIALSSPIGIEALARDAALELIDAHLNGLDALGERFSGWGPLATDRP